MDFNLNEQQRSIQAMAAKFAKDELKKVAAEVEEKEFPFPRAEIPIAESAVQVQPGFTACEVTAVWFPSSMHVQVHALLPPPTPAG